MTWLQLYRKYNHFYNLFISSIKGRQSLDLLLFIWPIFFIFLLISKHKLKPQRIPAIKTCRRRIQGDQGYNPCVNRDSICAHKSSFIGTLSVVIIYELALTGFTVCTSPEVTHTPQIRSERETYVSAHICVHLGLVSTYCAMKSTFFVKEMPECSRPTITSF